MKKNSYVSLKDLITSFLVIAIEVLIFVAVFLLLPKLILFFMPLILGYLISIMSNKLVTNIENRFKVNRRQLSVVIVVLVTILLFGAIFAILYYSYTQVSKMVYDVTVVISDINLSLENTEGILNNFISNLPFDINLKDISMPRVTSDGALNLLNDLSKPIINLFVNFIKYIPAFLINFIFTILSAYVLINENKEFNAKMKKVLPKDIDRFYKFFKTDVITIFNGWLKAQLIVIGIVFVILFIGLSVIGTKHAVLVSILITVVDALPIFGSGFFLWPWFILSLMGREFAKAFILIIMYFLIQFVRNVIQNRIMSSDFGLSGVATIFILFLGVKLYGFVGLIFAIPVGVFILSLYRFGIFDNLMLSIKNFLHDLKKFLTQKNVRKK